MRLIFTLILFALSISLLQGQIKLQEFPLESNPILQKVEAERLKAQEEKLIRYFGAEAPNTRTVNELNVL